MSSRQSPLPVPHINSYSSSTPTSTPTGRRTPSPEISCFSPLPNRTQARPQYFTDFIASSSALPRTPPVNLLRTSPSPEPQSQSRQDQSYFTPRSNYSQSRHTRTTTPSDNLSNSCISPGLSSGGSFHSSETGRSPCSNSSSEFLTPPRGQLDTDNPPYKARRASSESLTMVRKLRRANTTPYDKEHNRKGRHRKHHKCRQNKTKMHEHQTRSYWWLAARCQVAPTAPAGKKQLCEAHAKQYPWEMKRGSNIDTHESLAPGLRSRPAPAVVTRRWSSVEVGAHQVLLESTLPVRPNTSNNATNSSQIDQFSPKILGQRYRSSTFTRGAINHDIVHTVRQRLTLRKIPHEELATPASITLRRASRERFQSFLGNGAGGSTPLAPQSPSLNQRRPSAAYLITTEDIDSITELIQANLKRGHGSNGRFDLHPPSLTTPSYKGTPSPSITNRGVVPTDSFPAELAVTVAEVHPVNTRPHSPLEYLQVIPPYKRKKDTISRTYSQKSVHEIIWEDSRSQRSASSVTDKEDPKRSAAWEYSSEPSTPGNTSLHQAFQAPRYFVSDKGDAFDPKNAKASISEWSWRCPQNEIALVVTPSHSDFNERSPVITRPQIQPKSSFAPKILASKGTSSAKVGPPLRSAASETTLQDVVSFPPLLSRKTTNDWYSPLPPIEMSPPLTKSRSLYDIGIDVSFGPSSSKTVTPKSSQTSWVRTAETPHSQSVEFNPSYEIKSKSPETNLNAKVRQQSVVRAHPNKFARTGDPSAVGSSIGASSGERRKSSSPSIRHKASSCLHESSEMKSLVGSSSSERRSPPPRIQRKDSPLPGDVFRAVVSHGVDVGERKESQPPRWPHDAVPRSETLPKTPSPSAHSEGRRCSSPRIQRVRTVDNAHKGERDAPPSKWRAPSPCPTPRSPSPSEYEDARQSPLNSPSPGRNPTRRRSGWVDRLSLIRDRSPPLPAVDHVGIYGRMTGSQGAAKGDTRQDPCNPPLAEAHDCDDCAKDPRTPSVDWIG